VKRSNAITREVRADRRARRAAEQQRLQEQQRQEAERRDEEQRKRLQDKVLADQMRLHLAIEHDAKIEKLRGPVAGLLKLYVMERRNDIDAAALFAGIERAAPGRYTIDEVEAALASLEADGNLARIREAADADGD
jgi:hypothetical protein